GIGRLVFRALNAVEIAFAIVLAVTAIVGPPPIQVAAALAVAVAALGLQLGAVRPKLHRRSDRVLAGLDGPRSHGHYAYVGLEAIKTLALAAGGILLLSS
ncbi:MAG: hypothetical protein JO259_02210, partial [Mycobacterium sp.]|nr:hypothetical protein [Mycobacterium sp.]